MIVSRSAPEIVALMNLRHTPPSPNEGIQAQLVSAINGPDKGNASSERPPSLFRALPERLHHPAHRWMLPVLDLDPVL
jgi:hypothetical protein